MTLLIGTLFGGARAVALEATVMSFNIRFGTASDGDNRWENRKELVFDVIRSRAADVVGLQEALRFQIDEIHEAVPGYGEIGVGRDDGKARGEYAAILYREDRFEVSHSGTFWLSDTPDVVASTHWGNEITRICTWARLVERASGEPLWVFNVHLDHVSQRSRERSVELVAARILEWTRGRPFVFLGDFNAAEDNPAIRYLKGEVARASSDDSPAPPRVSFRDTFRVLHPDATDVGTFNGFRGRTGGGKIDHVFVPAWARVKEAAIVRDHEGDRYPSDHFPVTATVVFPEVRES